MRSLPNTDPRLHEPSIETIVDARNEAGRPTLIHYECRDCGRRVAYQGSRPKHLSI